MSLERSIIRQLNLTPAEQVAAFLGCSPRRVDPKLYTQDLTTAPGYHKPESLPQPQEETQQ